MMKSSKVSERYGRLTVLSEGEKNSRHCDWICECDCGDLVLVRGDLLATGAVDNCGLCTEEKDPAGLWNPPLQKSRMFADYYREMKPRRVTRRVDKDAQFRQLMVGAMESEWQ